MQTGEALFFVRMRTQIDPTNIIDGIDVDRERSTRGHSRCDSCDDPPWGLPMKRDLGLIRKLLLRIEADETLAIPEYGAREVTRHMALLPEAGLVEADIRSIANGVRFIRGSRLTWAGYEYL